jgi:hypothetical protein
MYEDSAKSRKYCVFGYSTVVLCSLEPVENKV